MQLLYLLESIRTPLLDALFSVVTHGGEEILFMVIAMTAMWCVDKYQGYYILVTGLLGTQINQLLKVTFRIERPWVKDPQFTIVESARAEATGYSFPSGHTQCAVGTYGALARANRSAWLRMVCIVLCVLVPFSRLYLGVHTPLDVGVSVAVALALVFGLYPLMHWLQTKKHGFRIFIAVLLVLSLAQAIYMTVTLGGEAAPELQSGLKTAYKMLGSVAGFWVVYELDVRFIHFDTKAVWWVQILKVVLGLGLTLGVKELAYLAFSWIPSEPLSRCFAYFVLVIFAGAVWPLTFRLFGKWGQKKVDARNGSLC